MQKHGQALRDISTPITPAQARRAFLNFAAVFHAQPLQAQSPLVDAGQRNYVLSCFARADINIYFL